MCQKMSTSVNMSIDIASIAKCDQSILLCGSSELLRALVKVAVHSGIVKISQMQITVKRQTASDIRRFARFGHSDQLRMLVL